jgi:exonuclease VII large subunit
LAVLDRGYALVTDGNAQALRNSSQTHSGAQLHIQLARGQLRAQVTEVVAPGEAD